MIYKSLFHYHNSLWGLLCGVCMAAAVSSAADARTIRWVFTLVAGADPSDRPDANWREKKRLCIPDNNGFITRFPVNGDALYIDDTLKVGELIEPNSLTVANKSETPPDVCVFQHEKQEPSNGKRCVDFWNYPGPRGARVCVGNRELRINVEK